MGPAAPPRAACVRVPATHLLLGLVGALLVSACTGPAAPTRSSGTDSTGSTSPATLAAAPPPQPPPLLTRAKVTGALGKLDGVVQDTMTRTGVPGIAVAVVYRDRAVYLKGFGVRRIGTRDRVDPNTVFQLASVSKPLASTVVAALVGRKVLTWDDPVVRYDPGFALKDPWVSAHVTLADLFAHRSGLPDHAGDLLEDLGYDRSYVLARLRQEPLAAFRASYAYTNFGLTEAGVAAARAAGRSWEQLSADVLYRPLGMRATSSRFADYQRVANKAVTHVRVNGAWQARYTRQPDAQSPAGGASSTARDMAQWMRLQLENGSVEGRRLVAADSLERTHLPHSVSRPAQEPGGRTDFYGLGWNVGYDDHGRLRLSHSGAFALGAATTVAMLPSEQLGIVVLTNGEPVGAPEAVANTFLDIAQDHRPSVDWLGFAGEIFAAQHQSERSRVDYAKPPAHPTPARPAEAYLGSYANDYYGPLTVTRAATGLVMQLGPRPLSFPLTHYDRDTFSYPTTGENAVALSGVTFTGGSAGRSTKVTVENLNDTGLGTFIRH